MPDPIYNLQVMSEKNLKMHLKKVFGHLHLLKETSYVNVVLTGLLLDYMTVWWVSFYYTCGAKPMMQETPRQHMKVDKALVSVSE